MENRISLQIAEADMAEIEAAISTLNTKLKPLLVNLDDEERQQLPKMGNKTVSFVTKGISHIEANPSLVPPYLEVDDIKTDFEATTTMKPIHTSLKQLVELLDDSMMLAGSEAYTGILAFYNYIKGAAKAGIPGADVLYDDMKARFPGR